MLAPQADRVVALGEWEERWQEDRNAFPESGVNKMLESNINKVLSRRTGGCFFFTLCGKAVDMKCSERNISLYQCDLYSFSSSIEGQFGAIWDRGSLASINPRDREQYAALIISLMAKDCRYLLDTLLFNPELYKGPPFSVPEEQVNSVFGNSCDMELLPSLDALGDRQRGLGLDYRTEHVHLITPKSI